MKNFIRKYYAQILIAFVTFIFLEIALYFSLGFLPFKNSNLLISDLYYEYVPFFYYVRNAILNSRSLFNSFSFSLGQSIVGILTYYCLSPLNLLILFSNINNITYFIKILLFLKIILCGINMSIYLNDKTSKLNNIIFSLIYAFISYNIRYGFNLMWLDVIYMLPLAILGLEKLIDGKSKKLYIISLTIMIFSNFYLAFSACIFILIYFFYYSLVKNKLTLKLFFTFAFSSLIAVLLNAFMLIPTIYNMLDGKAINAVSKYDKPILYNPINVIYNFAPGLTAGNLLNDLPYFYSSTLILIIFINYLFNDEISDKERGLSFLVTIFIIFATLIGPIDLIFHCFKVPNSLYYRYIYILPFFLISTVSKNKIKVSFYSLIPIILIIVWVLSIEISIKMIIFSSLMVLYFICIKANLKYLLIILVIGELFYNAIINFSIYNGFGGYNNVTQYYKLLSDNLPKENEFYRIEIKEPITVNDSFILGYYGINSFSPTISNNAKVFLKGYLLTAENHSLNYVYQNRFILDPYFLGIKYEIGENQINENEYYLPLVIKTHDLDYFYSTKSLIENSNNLYKMINGEHLFKEIAFEIDCIKDEVVINKKCNVNYDKREGYNYYIELYTKSGKLIDGNKYVENNIIIDLDKTFDLDYDKVHVDSVKLYEFDKKSIKNQENNFEVFKDDYMRLKVKKGLYMTTIPYDESWHISLNGREIKKIKVLDSLIGFEVEDGTLELEFIPRGINLGILISGMTFISIFSYYVRKRWC